MSDIGLFNAKFEINQNALAEFDSALRIAKSVSGVAESEKLKVIKQISNVLLPIVAAIENQPTTAPGINEQNILAILHKAATEKKGLDWLGYKNNIQAIFEKVRKEDLVFTNSEFSILNDIGDALDIECNRYYQRIRG